jgi:hypothetical protein
MTVKTSLLLITLLWKGTLYAQGKQDKLPVRFGKVTPEDFSVPLNGSDSAAGAVIIADYGTSAFEGDVKGWFTLQFKHSCRIKILKRSGFDAATISIPLYTAGNELEKVEGLHAVTYNLENGKVVETKLDDKSVFTDKISKNWLNKKFTFPALKEGSIVEYSYTQTSPFLFQLQPWEFQGEYPRLWSEYQVDIPNFFEYATIAQGFLPFNINTSDTRQVTFNMTDPGGAGKDEKFTFSDNVVTHRWVMKNIPALKEEPFTTTLNNYTAKIEFQLSRYNFPNSIPKDKMGNWLSMTSAFLEEDDFGADLSRSNSWLDEDMKTITKGAKTDLEKSRLIYAYVRDNFICTAHSSLYLANPLKTVYKNKSGSEAELNLLLTAMLHHEKITADPVILSTRSHGFASQLYPMVSRYNYVISAVTIDSSRYYLDASEPWLGFGRLPERCYNGYARLLNKDRPSALTLDADELHENKQTLVIVAKDEKGKGLTARLQSTPGYNEACTIRQKIKDHGQQDFIKAVQTAYTSEQSVSNFELDSLKLPDEPLALAYDIQIDPDESSDVFYFNPMFSEGYKENPFKAAQREYPVEMSGAMDELYTMNMEIPDGYVVDELPRSAKVLLNEDEGLFEYLILKDGDNIQFRSHIVLKKANYKPEDYATLRDFFGVIVKKQSEQIVFKKKKA